MMPQICIEELKDEQISHSIYCSFNSLSRLTAERTVAAAVVEYTHAPPATVR